MPSCARWARACSARTAPASATSWRSLGGLLGGIQQPGGRNAGAAAPSTGQNNPLGGDLGATIGNLIQQGLGGLGGQQPAQPQPQPSTGRSQGRSIPARDARPGAGAADADGLARRRPPPPANRCRRPQESQPMNDVLRQLFNR